MAEVEDVIFGIAAGSSEDKVTVKYKLAFNGVEAGKQYKLAIRLFSEDLPLDLVTVVSGPIRSRSIRKLFETKV